MNLERPSEESPLDFFGLSVNPKYIDPPSKGDSNEYGPGTHVVRLNVEQALNDIKAAGVDYLIFENCFTRDLDFFVHIFMVPGLKRVDFRNCVFPQLSRSRSLFKNIKTVGLYHNNISKYIHMSMFDVTTVILSDPIGHDINPLIFIGTRNLVLDQIHDEILLDTILTTLRSPNYFYYLKRLILRNLHLTKDLAKRFEDLLDQDKNIKGGYCRIEPSAA